MVVLVVLVAIVFPWPVFAAPLAPDTGLSRADTIFQAEAQGDNAGSALAGLGDVNGDGLPDFAVSAPQNDEAAIDAGQVYLFFGRAEGWPQQVDLALASASFLGERPNAHAGSAVAAAGDVNGDGYDDILIGANLDGEAGVRAGQVYLILGKEAGWERDTPLSQADASFLGEADGDEAGTSVAGAGDVSGDGLDDLLIGAPKNAYAGERAGQAYLVLGRESGWLVDTPLSAADASFMGQGSFESAAGSLAVVRDANGDGLDDLLIGSWRRNNLGGPNAGEAYLILGRQIGWTMRTSLAASDASFMGENLGHWAGYSVAGVGDVNGDSLGDLLVGAPGNDDHGRQTGEAYLVLGKASGWAMNTSLAEVDASFRSEWWGHTWTGSAVAGAGDVNADGLDDLLIAGIIDEEGGLDAGQVHLVLGQSTGWMQNSELVSAVSFWGEAPGDQSGKAVAGVGDVNGDGLDDLLVGAPLNDAAAPDAGQAYLLLGNAGPATGRFAPDRPFLGVGSYHTFSTSFFDQGDGWADVKLVQIQARGGGTALAIRYHPATDQLWLREKGTDWQGPCRRGRPGTLVGITLELDCEGTTATNDTRAELRVGWRLRVIRPVNKPYSLDFTLRASDLAGHDSLWQAGGSWDVDPDSHELDLSEADALFLGEEAWDLAGWSVSAAGDVNGDGLQDVIVGAPSNGEATPVGGQIYLFLGDEAGWPQGLSLAGADASFTGEGEYSYAGYAVAGVGDANDDGYDDFLIGAFGNREVGDVGGQAYLILGKADGWALDTPLSEADASFVHEGSELVGWSVAGAGDVNADGYDDLLIGAREASGGVGPAAGMAFLVLGKASGWAMDTHLSLADASYVGESARQWAGYALAGGGDVNGDGYDDFLVGAPTNAENGLQAGQAYLILGKTSGWAANTSLGQADASFLGAAGDRAGMALAGAGDVNDDGNDDLLITAWGNGQGGGPEAGQVYLFLGRSNGWTMDTPLAQAEASFVGEHAGDRTGHALAALGDLNADGYDDLAIGAPGNDDGGAFAGKVYVILGQGSGWTPGTSLATAFAAYWGEKPGDRAGHSLAGPGTASLLIGAPGSDEAIPGGYNGGKIYHVLLSP